MPYKEIDVIYYDTSDHLYKMTEKFKAAADDDPLADGVYHGTFFTIFYKNGKHHREDGPAVEWHIGTKYWYYNGQKINASSQEEFKKILKLKAFL